jgi:hypothetical protein
MLPLVPIVVGVTGKRDLEGRKDYVEACLREALEEVEKRFPNTPLVLATGLAKGADLLAADVALARPQERWTVVGVLPFAPRLFLEDFTGEGDAEWRERFFALLPEENPHPGENPTVGNPRFVKKILKPLRKEKSAERFVESELHRTDDNLVRRRHYEQAGLVIADRCTLLIAVMPEGEKPGKLGGTARIVKYKRDGRLDAEADAVARASDEIAAPELLDGEVKGLVTVIDLDGDSRGEAASAFDTLQQNNRYAWLTLEQIEEFNDIARRRDAQSTRVPGAHELFGAADVDYLSQLRRALSDFQGLAKGQLTRSMWGIATLFVISVGLLETFAKQLFEGARWLYAGYGVVIVAGLLLFYRVRKRELQAFSEDYRGAAEAMRVQAEWWRLGLREPKHRVDRYYLAGGEGHFAVLRNGIKAALDAMVLLRRDPAAPGEPLELQNVKSWVPGQADWFERRSDERHRTAIRLSSLAWYLFQLSVGAGLAIGVLVLLTDWSFLAGARNRMFNLVEEHRSWLSRVVFLVAVLWGAFLLAWVRAPQDRELPADAGWWEEMKQRLRYRKLPGTRGRHSGRHGWPIALPLGFLMVPALVALVQSLGDAHTTEDQIEHLLHKAEHMSLVLMIALAAASGALRFVLERRALEAEAVSYREARQRFRAALRHAEQTRKEAAAQPNPAEFILKEDQKLGLELGKAALAENEAWVRTHRQRPFEPVGG